MLVSVFVSLSSDFGVYILSQENQTLSEPNPQCFLVLTLTLYQKFPSLNQINRLYPPRYQTFSSRKSPAHPSPKPIDQKSQQTPRTRREGGATNFPNIIHRKTRIPMSRNRLRHGVCGSRATARAQGLRQILFAGRAKWDFPASCVALYITCAKSRAVRLSPHCTPPSTKHARIGRLRDARTFALPRGDPV